MLNALLPYAFIDRLSDLSYVETIYVFGSRAREDQAERSDIDLAIKLSEDTPTNWSKVLDVIEQADTLLSIDCVNISGAGDALRRRILEQGKVIYERKT